MQINEQFHPAEIESWVNVEEATASRRIFADEAIFQLEMERIFGNAWLYIGHESEIPAVGDFVTRLMGKDPVILVRVTENEIAVLLNSCPHRGAMLCQADAGNGKGLICPYHGWAFSNAGRLVATSTDDGLYADRVDFRTLDLRSAAKVSSYAGLIYATWNADAPSLDDYLGDIRWAIDLCFNRTPGGVEVLGAPHRWEMGSNWKIGPINFSGDGPHFTQLHGPIAKVTQGIEKPDLRAALQASNSISWGNGHNGVIQMTPEDSGIAFFGQDPDLIPLMEQTLQPDQLAVRKRILQAVNNVFPNHSWTHNPVSYTPGKPPVHFLAMRVWQPVAANRTQIWNWFFADKESSEEWKHQAALAGLRSFSVGGTFDLEDAETWDALGGSVGARQVDGQIISYQATLAHRDRIDPTWPGPGKAYDSGYAEATEFDFLIEWQKQMSGKN